MQHDGTRVVDAPTTVSGTWQEFLPGALPGGPAATELDPIAAERGNTS